MSHNLFLGMYTFKLKKLNTSNNKLIENNDFLSKAYPDKNNKFSEGFVQDIINLIDEKAFKNDAGTHGAVLEQKAINAANRTLDIIINGGLTGIKQFIIDESGGKKVLSNKEIVGPKFYARVWLPANTKTGYLFIQKYGSLTIKPVFDSIFKKVFKQHGYNIVENKISATTTKIRQKEFMNCSSIKDIVIVSKESSHNTGSADATRATIRLSNIKSYKNKKIQKKDINEALGNHGFSISNRGYEVKATYEQKTDDYKEEKTIYLDASEETINIIPNVKIPYSCIDPDNYPIFSEMQVFVDKEMLQVKKEAKS